jgi:hypothetical protein
LPLNYKQAIIKTINKSQLVKREEKKEEKEEEQ